jgi:hypothetical protein
MSRKTASLDLLWGAAAIAEVLNLRPRQAFHMLENGEIPGKKVGGRWVVDRQKLAEFFLSEDSTSGGEETAQ